MKQNLDLKLLKILACPICKGNVFQEEDKIICPKCNLSYPIKDNIPVMIIEDAKKYKK
jgi:uncharacterized protein YbaR (Trm112 family)|tara:strand:- start:1074 stop:1247 length:174 start_codon:yes stop_codon:yes gene_type:complete